MCLTILSVRFKSTHQLTIHTEEFHKFLFLVIQFEDFVYPSQIYIFETYNPGAVVKVWAFTITEKWICLWENDETDASIPTDSRVFSPIIKEIKIPTKIIRIEFNHSNLEYFTEIDGVLLEGIKYDDSDYRNMQLQSLNRSQTHKGPIQRKLEKCSFKTVLTSTQNQDQDQVLKDFLIKDLENFIAEINISGSSITSISNVPDDMESTPFTLKNMPVSIEIQSTKLLVHQMNFYCVFVLFILQSEILLKICSYLDLVSLFRVTQTCRKLHQVACDPSLYTEINLMPYWDVVDTSVLSTLNQRCRYLKKVDLSWCGLFNNLTSSDFKGYVITNFAFTAPLFQFHFFFLNCKYILETMNSKSIDSILLSTFQHNVTVTVAINLIIIMCNCFRFIRLCGKQVTHLRLNSVKFISSDSLEIVGMICDNLRGMSSIHNITIFYQILIALFGSFTVYSK